MGFGKNLWSVSQLTTPGNLFELKCGCNMAVVTMVTESVNTGWSLSQSTQRSQTAEFTFYTEGPMCGHDAHGDTGIWTGHSL
jgi:hypothetical protein